MILMKEYVWVLVFLFWFFFMYINLEIRGVCLLINVK